MLLYQCISEFVIRQIAHFFQSTFFYRKATTNLLLRLAGKKGKKIRVHRFNAFSQCINQTVDFSQEFQLDLFLPAIFFSLEQQHYKRDVQTRAEEGKRNGRKTRLKRAK